MSGKQPFLPLFFGDFLAATADWEGEEQALYLLLLGHQWSLGSLPPEPARLCKLVRWDKRLFERMWPTVSKKFQAREGRLYNDRLEQHRERSSDLSSRRSGAGKGGAAARWKGGDTDGTRSERLAAARAKGTHTSGEWAALVDVCGDRCVICNTAATELDGGTLCKDHILPIYAGGSDGIDNIQPSCRNCNSRKGADTTDHRPNDWRERLAGLLINVSQSASKTPSKTPLNGCHPSHPIPKEEKNPPTPLERGAGSLARPGRKPRDVRTASSAAWGSVVEGAGRSYTRQELEHADPVLAAAVTRLGGWNRFGQSTAIGTLKEPFRELYEQILVGATA